MEEVSSSFNGMDEAQALREMLGQVHLASWAFFLFLRCPQFTCP